MRRIWAYVGSAAAATEEAARALARVGAVWAPGNLIERDAAVEPGCLLLLFWRESPQADGARLLGGASVAVPHRAWGETRWLDTVARDDPLYRAAKDLGYRGPPNYMAMIRIGDWTEDWTDLRRRAPGVIPPAETGTALLGLPRGSLLVELGPDQLRAPAPSRSPEDAERITIDPSVLGGKPVIRGMRIAVEHVLGWLAAGADTAEIVESYPELTDADVRACLRYAERLLSNERVEPGLAG